MVPPCPATIRRGVLFSIALGFQVAAAANAVAAAPLAAVDSGRSASAAGIVLSVPRDLAAKVEAASAPAEGQWLAQATLTRQGAEIVRVEVYANPRGQTLGAWVAAAWQDLSKSALLRPTTAGIPRWSALRGEISASPQSHPREVAFIGAGQRLVHVACTLPDAQARRACAAVLASLDKAGAP